MDSVVLVYWHGPLEVAHLVFGGRVVYSFSLDEADPDVVVEALEALGHEVRELDASPMLESFEDGLGEEEVFRLDEMASRDVVEAVLERYGLEGLERELTADEARAVFRRALELAGVEA